MKSAKRYLTDEEIQKLLIDGFTGDYRLRNRAIFAMGISTGYRAKELLAHKIRDVMARSKVLDHIYLPAHLRKGGTSGQSKKLMPVAKKALQEHIDDVFEQADAERYGEIFDWPLFMSNKTDPHTGNPRPLSVKSLCRIFQDAYYRCDITGAVATHSMRKTSAKKCYDKAVKDFRNGNIDIEPIRVVKMFLGHSDIATTERYLTFLSYELDEDQYDFEL